MKHYLSIHVMESNHCLNEKNQQPQSALIRKKTGLKVNCLMQTRTTATTQTLSKKILIAEINEGTNKKLSN